MAKSQRNPQMSLSGLSLAKQGNSSKQSHRRILRVEVSSPDPGAESVTARQIVSRQSQGVAWNMTG